MVSEQGAPGPAAAAPSSPFTPDFDSLVAEALDKLHAPGLALAVVDGDHTWAKGYGCSDVEAGTKVTERTLFSVGSTTKSFTAAAASLLVDEMPDVVTWDTPVSALIPADFVLEEAYATAHVTVADCLAHRTGMPGHRVDLGSRSLRDNVRNLRHLPMGGRRYQLRGAWEYSNHMYWAVSHAIEQLTGRGLGDFLRERIWAPLDMRDTVFSIAEALESERRSDGAMHLARPHVWDGDRRAFDVIPVWDDAGVSGAGCIVSTVADFAKWVRAFAHQEPSSPLSQAGFAAVTGCHMVSPATNPRLTGPVSYGFGWWSATYRGERLLYHPGGIAGSCSTMVVLPDRNWAVAGMCCASGLGPFGALEPPVWRLVDDVLGVPLDKRLDVIPLAADNMRKMDAHVDGARARLFPSIPSPPVRPSLPLPAYLGSYKHPAYGTITLSECSDDSAPSELRGVFPVKLLLGPFVLEHVAGEHFLVKVDVARVQKIRTRARFEVDATGSPARLGVEFEDGHPDIVIWFARQPAGPVVPEVLR